MVMAGVRMELTVLHACVSLASLGNCVSKVSCWSSMYYIQIQM